MSVIEKDRLYELLTNTPDKQQFANIMKEQEYETNSIDFKETWIEKGKLAKIILAMANHGGGSIIFGIKETENHVGDPVGLSDDNMKDEAEVSNSIKKYIPDTILWKLLSFSFDGSEYEKMSGKSFQVIIVYDTPEFLPFISTSEGDELKSATIYTRRQTECVVANNSELQYMIDRRIETQYISKIEFSEHLKQLYELYKYHRSRQNPFYKFSPFPTQIESQGFISTINSLIEMKEKQIKQLMGIN